MGVVALHFRRDPVQANAANARSRPVEIFLYHAFVKADNLENLDQTIGCLGIPKTAEEAIELANTKGPNVLRRNADVEAARWNLKALRAEYGPRISVGASVSRGGYSDEFRIRDGGHTWTYWRTALPTVLGFVSESFHQY